MMKELAAERDAKAGEIKSGSLVLFFSFDLVNSTKYKSINRTGWPFVVRQFYEVVIDGMTKWLDEFCIWKYVGDEVLIYKSVSRQDQLRKAIQAAKKIIETTINEIHQAYPDTKKLLSVKGTVWCAKISMFSHEPVEIKHASEQYKYLNLAFRSGHDRDGQIDFLGPDIDVGFRIAKHTTRRRLVISAELAYLLYLGRASNAIIEKQLKIVSYEVLKGIWEDRRYPILWYEQDWDKVNSTFLYDERYDSETVRKIIDDSKNLGKLEELTKVFEDQDRVAELNDLWENLNSSKLVDLSVLLGVTPGFASKIEVHCAAVCFRDDGRVLVAKRPSDKRRYPGKWEFGCGQIAEGESIQQCLRRNYQADFNANLEFHGDPRPIQSYCISEASLNRDIPGIVFVAFVQNPEDIIVTKHSEFDWITPDPPPSRVDTDYVPESRERLKLAVAARNDMGFNKVHK